MVVGVHEQVRVRPELLVAVVMVSFDGCVLDGAVHPLDLTIGPGVVHLGQPVLDTVLIADAIEDVLAVADVAHAIGELDGVIGEHCVDTVRHGLDQFAQELRSLHLACTLDEANKGEFAGGVDGHKHAQLAFGRADLVDVDVEVADGVAREALLLGFVPLDLRQPAT